MAKPQEALPVMPAALRALREVLWQMGRPEACREGSWVAKDQGPVSAQVQVRVARALARDPATGGADSLPRLHLSHQEVHGNVDAIFRNPEASARPLCYRGTRCN